MRTVWIGKYQETEIRVENNWFHGEKLFVNGQLQDERLSFFSSHLTGHLISKQNERLNIKVDISGWFSIGCRLFVNDEKVEMIKQ